MRPQFKHALLIVCTILAPDSLSHAQTVHLLVPPKMQFIDANGKPLAGGYVYTYQAGTTSYQTTFTDYTGTAANTNPIVLDSGGAANIWLTDSLSYKICVQNKTHVPVFCTDGVSNPTGGTGPSGFNPHSPGPIGDVLPATVDGTTITAHNTFVGNLSGNVTGNLGGSVTGSLTGPVTGNLTGSVTGGTISGTTITASTGFNGPLTGNVTGSLNGNVTGTVTGSLNGNATSATTATTANQANNAAALTGLVHFRTSATCATGTSGGTQCTTTFTVPYSYSSAGTWDVICTGIGQTGSPYVLATAPQSGTTFNAVIGNTSVTGVAGSFAALSCISYGN